MSFPHRLAAWLVGAPYARELSREPADRTLEFRSAGACPQCGKERLIEVGVSVSSMGYLARVREYVHCACEERDA